MMLPLTFCLLFLSTTPSLTLHEAVDSSIRDNAQLTAERTRWQALQERPTEAATLPDPMFSYSGMDMANGGEWPDTSQKWFGVQQNIPGFSKLPLRKDIAQKDAEVAQWQVDAALRSLVMNVKESYFDLYAVQRSIAITRDEEGVIRGMESVAQTMYATGARPQTDVLKAQTESTLLEQKLLDLEAQETTLKAKLNTFMNRAVQTPIGTLVTAPQVDLDPNVQELLTDAAAGRPEVRAAQTRIERYGLETELKGKDFAPDYSLGVQYRSIRQGDDMFMFTIGFTLPLWQSKYQAGVREAEKMRAASRAAHQAAQRQSGLDVQDASFKLKTARQTLNLYQRELIPQAEARFNADLAGYQTGTVDFLNVLESERFLLNARLMAAQAEGDVGMQFARLERAVGHELKPETKSSEPAVHQGAGNGN